MWELIWQMLRALLFFAGAVLVWIPLYAIYRSVKMLRERYAAKAETEEVHECL